MPGQKCTICPHPQRGLAEAAIASGSSVRAVAKRYALSYHSLDRHSRNCISKAIQQAAEKRDVAFADALMTEVELLHRTTLDVLHESRDGKWLSVPDPEFPDDPNRFKKVYDLPNVKISIRAIAEARKNLALIARLTGQLEPREEDRCRTVTWEEFEAIYVRAKREVRS